MPISGDDDCRASAHVGLGIGGVLVGDHDVRAALGRAASATSRPMPLPPPTTSAIFRLNSRSAGIRCSFASSSAQYSIRNASVLGSAT